MLGYHAVDLLYFEFFEQELFPLGYRGFAAAPPYLWSDTHYNIVHPSKLWRSMSNMTSPIVPTRMALLRCGTIPRGGEQRGQGELTSLVTS